MKTSLKPLLALITATLLSQVAHAQDAEMADTFRSEGKIYVVVAIVLVVLAGFILYLFMLDRKVSKLERMVEDKKQTKPQGKAF